MGRVDRGIPTTYTFNAADQVVTVTTPAPGPGQPAQTTTTFYDSSLRAWKTTHPDGASVTREFYRTGLLKKQAGARTYPAEYTYDYAGRLQTLRVWRDAGDAQSAAVTVWQYEPQRGLLQRKTYHGCDTNQPGTSGPAYNYDSAGRLTQRVWARGVLTDYGYNALGELATVTYSDGTTPNVAVTYDRLGRPQGLSQSLGGASATVAYTFNPAGPSLSETWTGGPLGGLRLTNGYDGLMRRTTLAVLAGPSSLLARSTNSYDVAGRCAVVGDGDGQIAAYSYLANSPLVEQISFKQGSTVRMTTTKQYDFLNRLTGIASAAVGSTPVGFSYSHNLANQRTVRQEADGSYWRYEYDGLGQVIAGKKYWPDQVPVAGQQFEYAFDDIGNRIWTGAGGDENGLNLRWAVYAANELNQYWSNTVPAAVDVLGVSLATSAVQVNGLAAYRKGEYFRKELPVDNSGGPVWTNVTVTAAGQSAVSGHAAVAPALQGFSYDLDGNLTQDGLWVYTWDGENRLVAVESVWGVAEAGRRRVDFGYDAQGRRVEQVVSGWDGQGWGYVPQSTNRFVYDGWNLVAVLDGNNAPLLSFTWGADLSGSVQGAGGVGGLLSVTVHTGPNAGRYFYAYDGNGNVMALVSAADGSVAARYEYGPFGELIQATGPMAKTNPFLFSTKYYDWETGLYYYGYRDYDPGTGRWLSRDPIGEFADRNLYRFNYNNPVNFVDPNGLWGIQFGDFNIGIGNPTLAFDNDSWMDLANGAAATMDGLIPVYDPFADLYQNGDIWSDDYEPLSDWERDLYNKSHTGGQIAQVCLLSATPFRPFTRARQPITHFGGPLQPGQWVMTGGPTARNWLMAGAKPSWLLPANQTVATALPGSLRWPSGWQWIKGFLGQRIYAP